MAAVAVWHSGIQKSILLCILSTFLWKNKQAARKEFTHDLVALEMGWGAVGEGSSENSRASRGTTQLMLVQTLRV